MIRQAAAGAAATVPIPVVWDLFGLGYKFAAGPFIVSVLMVLITRLCVYLNTKGRRQVTLDIAVTALCSVVAALWTQAHSLDLLPAAISAMTIAAIGYGLIGMAKSQFVTALREAVATFLRGIAAAPAPTVETDDAAIDRLTGDIEKLD